MDGGGEDAHRTGTGSTPRQSPALGRRRVTDPARDGARARRTLRHPEGDGHRRDAAARERCHCAQARRWRADFDHQTDACHWQRRSTADINQGYARRGCCRRARQATNAASETQVARAHPDGGHRRRGHRRRADCGDADASCDCTATGASTCDCRRRLCYGVASSETAHGVHASVCASASASASADNNSHGPAHADPTPSRVALP